ncbi:MAG: cysteine desulfurase [Candidatus Colwellbacteria bacterium]|nr:cysteine desulfurase [Candidatus Colwellbacteria bacterium]
MRRIYLDHAATTPVSREVLRAMEPYFAEKFGNAGSVHSFGQEAIAAIDRSRETVAEAVGAEFRGVVFTGSATEANNLALRGVVKNYLRRARSGSAPPKIIVSAIEHESVLETARELAFDGAEVVHLPVNRRGVVDFGALARSLDGRTAIVSVMHGNNEVGVVEPIARLARIIREFRENQASVGDDAIHPLFHTDASQTFPYLDCDMNALGADLMTISAHKMRGPKGVGALCIRGGVAPLVPVTTGGGQEFGLRSGTENVPAIVGFARAVEIAARARERRSRRVETLRNFFMSEVLKLLPSARLNIFSGTSHLPHIVSLHIPGCAAEDLITALDLRGIAVSAGSACSMRSLGPSHVLIALGLPEKRAMESIRASFGERTTRDEIKEATRQLKEAAKRLTK